MNNGNYREIVINVVKNIIVERNVELVNYISI